VFAGELADCARLLTPAPANCNAHERAAVAGADNQIGEVGAAALAESVKASGTLTKLTLLWYVLPGACVES
jgi:hypothetical protein